MPVVPAKGRQVLIFVYLPEMNDECAVLKRRLMVQDSQGYLQDYLMYVAVQD